MKPDIRLFQAGLEKAGCKASEAIMVGDRLDNDIYPAKSLGMKTVWIKQGLSKFQVPKTAEFVPDYEINLLTELLTIL